MAILESFICFLVGVIFMIITAFLFRVSERLFIALLFSCISSLALLFLLAVMGFKFANITPFSCLVTGYLGVVGFAVVFIINIIF